MAGSVGNAFGFADSRLTSEQRASQPSAPDGSDGVHNFRRARLEHFSASVHAHGVAFAQPLRPGTSAAELAQGDCRNKRGAQNHQPLSAAISYQDAHFAERGDQFVVAGMSKLCSHPGLVHGAGGNDLNRAFFPPDEGEGDDPG